MDGGVDDGRRLWRRHCCMSPFHIALAGQYDWASVALLAAVTVVLLAVGIEAFARRDLAVTAALPAPSLPRPLLGLTGPVVTSIAPHPVRIAAYGAWLISLAWLVWRTARPGLLGRSR